MTRPGFRSPAGAETSASLPGIPRQAARQPDKTYRLALQSRALLELSRRDLLREGLERALQKIVDTSAAVLGVERVGIWLYDRQRRRIRCTVLHQESRPEGFDELDSDRYPPYFAALATHLVIDARNARADARTCVLDREYLGPLGIHSMLDAPIFVSGRMIGIVCQESIGSRRLWTEDEQRFACQLADLAGLVFQEHERRRAEAMTEALLEVAREVSGHLELDDILAGAMQKVAGLLGCDAVAIFRIEEQTRETRLIAHFGLTTELAGLAAELVFTDAQPLAAAVRRGETVVLDHTTSQDLISRELADRFRVRSLVVSPLRTRARHFGSLVALHQGERTFDLREVEFCTAVAAQVAGAMDVGELYRRERENAELSSALVAVGREMNSALSAELLLDRLCHRTAHLVGAEQSHVCLFDAEEVHVVPVAGFEAGRGSVRGAAARVRAEDLRSDLELLDRDGLVRIEPGAASRTLLEPLARDLGYATASAVPLRVGARLIGFHVVGARERGRGLGPAQDRLLRGIAEIASLALANARLVGQLERANAVKSDFLSAMSHELRTPLHVILGYTEMLLDGAHGPVPEPQREPLVRIDAQSRALFELISSTLDLGRLEEGRVLLDVRDVDLRAFLAEVAEEARGTAVRRKRDVAVALEVGAAPDRIRTDPGKLRMVLRNLLDNAIKFTETGSIRLSCDATARGLELAVEDTGIGIPPDLHSEIFESFRQGDAALSARFGGVGLGLYVVRRLVELLEGQISLRSRVGEGSRFAVVLPHPEAASA